MCRFSSLIGTSLIGNSGVLNWGGGTDCHNSTSEFYALCPNVDAPKAAAFASPRMIGLGFVSFMTIILVSHSPLSHVSIVAYLSGDGPYAPPLPG